MIRIRVRDDGVGISKDRLRELRGRLAQGKATEHSGGASIGLANIHQRLRTEFGDACGLEIQSTENQYTEISFLLPFSVNTDGEAERS